MTKELKACFLSFKKTKTKLQHKTRNKNQASFFSDPPEKIAISGPDEVDDNEPARFTCRASASNLPSKLAFKLTSEAASSADLISDLEQNGLVQVEEPEPAWQPARGDFEDQGWATQRSMVISPQYVQHAGQYGRQLTVECFVSDPYHDRRILVSSTKYVAVRGNKIT